MTEQQKKEEKERIEKMVAKQEDEIKEIQNKQGVRMVLYSWKGKDGYKEYSNVGFPKDKEIQEAKINYFYR